MYLLIYMASFLRAFVWVSVLQYITLIKDTLEALFQIEEGGAFLPILIIEGSSFQSLPDSC